jgi:hypothetical protein
MCPWWRLVLSFLIVRGVLRERRHAARFFFACVKWRRGGAIVKKGFCLATLSLLFACFCLSYTALPAFAAPAHVTISAIQVTRTASARRWHSRTWWPHFYHRGSKGLEINQYHQGDTNHDIPTTTYGGHDQGNTGNNGHNRGHNQDDSLNGGNQLIVTSRLRGYRRVNQYYSGDSNYRNSFVHWGGYDQGNTGNSGSNEGLNQDDSSNGGNQIIN